MINKIKSKLKNREGSSVIEFAIGLLLFVLLTAFVVDMLFVGNKRFLVAREATEISRMMAVQGGVKSITPVGYPGGNKTYTTSRELLKNIDTAMTNAGVKEGWSVTLTKYNKQGQIIKQGYLTEKTNLEVDYMESMDVEIHATYKWLLMSQFDFVGLKEEADVGAKRHSVSEFKYNFDDWEGEKINAQ